MDTHTRQLDRTVPPAETNEQVDFLMNVGLLPEALSAAPQVADQSCPDLALKCAAALRPIRHLDIRYEGAWRRFAVQVWEFSEGANRWVVGNDEIGIYGSGRDLHRAAEYFTERLRKLEAVFASCDRPDSASPHVRRVVDWIGKQEQIDAPSRASNRAIAWDGYQLYKSARYGDAKAVLDMANENFVHLERSARIDLRRFSAFTSVRCGQLVAGAYGQEHLTELSRYERVTQMTCSDFLCCNRYAGLYPSPEVEPWFRRGVELSGGAGGSGAKALIYLYGGMTKLARGQSAEARSLLQTALEVETGGMAELRVAGLILVGLAEVDRVQGEFERARETLRQVRQGQESEELWGDLGDFTLTGLAKLEGDYEIARDHLEQATAYGVRTGNLKCQLRAVLIEARICRQNARRLELRSKAEALADQIVDARRCPLVQRILKDWNRWTSGVASPETDYWGL